MKPIVWSGSVVAIATTALLPLDVAAQTNPHPLEESAKAVLDEAWQIVQTQYVDGSFNQVDWEATRYSLLSRQYTSREAAYGALRSALNQLEDPYTRFLDPQEYAELSQQTAGEISGIGVRLHRDSATNRVVITEVVDGSPAHQGGLQVGDQLLVVDGQATDRLSIGGISQRLRGELGTQVTLTLSSNGTQRTVILVRAQLELPTVERAVRQHGTRRIGYIRLLEFNAHAAEQMQEAIQVLETDGVDGFVLDLRGNPGGLLNASIDISRMWLQRGSIVETVYRDGHSESVAANRTALTQLPLTVLVDNRSASSSEILTGALRDNGRATVVGTTTYGKALVQSLHPLSDGSGLTVTVAHYYTPNGTDISRRGIAPDVEIDLSLGERQVLFNNPSLLGTDADPQYLRAVQMLSQDTAEGEATPSQLGRREN